MTRIEFEPGALADLDRITDFLMANDPDNAKARKDELLGGLRVLTYAPQVGRRAQGSTRNLVVGKAARGYAVRYRPLPRIDAVVVVAVRHQRESR